MPTSFFNQFGKKRVKERLRPGMRAETAHRLGKNNVKGSDGKRYCTRLFPMRGGRRPNSVKMYKWMLCRGSSFGKKRKSKSTLEQDIIYLKNLKK